MTVPDDALHDNVAEVLVAVAVGVPGTPGTPPPQPVVVAVTAALRADSPFELYAATVYVCAEQLARPETVALVPVTVARTVVPSYTRYPVTVPLEAPHDSAIDVLVMLPALGVPGTPGGPAPPGPSSETSSA